MSWLARGAFSLMTVGVEETRDHLQRLREREGRAEAPAADDLAGVEDDRLAQQLPGRLPTRRDPIGHGHVLQDLGIRRVHVAS
jgi:hypothetical protein